MATSPIPTLILNNGQSVPIIGLGTWQSLKGDCVEAVKTAIECGYRHFDTAAIYGNEAEIGEGIKDKINDGTITRDDLFISTKLCGDHQRPDLVESAIRDSLERFGVGYVDLFLIHAPFGVRAPDEGGMMDSDGKYVPSDVDYLDTWKAMEQLVDKGLTRSIGVSNFNSEQLARLLSMEGLKYKPVVIQIEVQPYLNNDQLIAFCKEREITVTAYAPFACSGFPPVKPGDPCIFDEPSLKEIGRKYGKSVAQVALRWGVQRNTIVIPKSVTPARIRENIQIFDFELTTSEMSTISALSKNFRTFTFPADFSRHKNYPFNIAF